MNRLTYRDNKGRPHWAPEIKADGFDVMIRRTVAEYEDKLERIESGRNSSTSNFWRRCRRIPAQFLSPDMTVIFIGRCCMDGIGTKSRPGRKPAESARKSCG